MNRSFRAPESPMQDAFKQRQQQLGTLRSSPRVRDRDDELALFFEMRNREKERTDSLLRAAEEFDGAPLGSISGNSPLFNVPSAPVRKSGADDFLNSENDKHDYDWLLTPPGSPLFPSMEMDTAKTVKSQPGAPTARPTALKARFANPPSEVTGRSNLISKQLASSPGLTSSGGGTRRPSSSGGGTRRSSSYANLSELTGRSNLVSKQSASSPGLTSSGGGTRRPSSSGGGTRRSLSSGNLGSRPATPTGRPTSTTVSKSSTPSTPTSRTTIPSTRSVVATTKTSVSSAKPVVSATKTAPSVTKTTTVPAAKATIPSRSSTPSSRSIARSSTPTTRPTLSASRPTLPASRPTSRASTPTRRPTTPSNVHTVSTPPVKTSSISKSASVMSRQSVPSHGTSRQPVPSHGTSRQPVPSHGTSRLPVPSHGTSPTVKSRPWKPSDMPGFSLDAPPNLRTTLPERPLSTTRGRPGAPGARSSSVEPATSGRPRRQSCSPSRGPNGISRPTGSSMPAVNRVYSKANDNVSPVMMGTKMVERVINMRKLAPPSLDNKNSPHNLSGKLSSPDSSGFGRSLSKKSLDMAIRHMDIRRRIPGNVRPSMTNIPASSLYSVRSGSGPQRSRTISISGSPHATSSNASSELSVNQNGLCLDNSEIDDDIGSERGVQSPASVRGR